MGQPLINLGITNALQAGGVMVGVAIWLAVLRLHGKVKKIIIVLNGKDDKTEE